MEIQYGKMILYGILSAIFYLVVPFVVIYALEYYDIMTFSESFKTSIIIFGVIGVVLSILSHAFPKDTSANRLVRFGVTIYSGIFLFYIFGGFEPGSTFGAYAITTPIFQVLLGLQIIAWLFLGSTIIRGLQYLIEAIELSKKREYQVKVKKQFKLSKVFKVLGILASIATFAYFGSLIFSGMNLGFNLHKPPNPPYYDNNGTPLDFSDDSLTFTLTFDVDNGGIYAIRNVSINAELYTGTTDNATALPWYTKIGGSSSPYQKTFHSFTNTMNQNVSIIITNTNYLIGLNTTNAKLFLKLSFSTTYAWIFIALNVSLPFDWTHP